jgi:uncharacterized protein YjdB
LLFKKESNVLFPRLRLFIALVSVVAALCTSAALVDSQSSLSLLRVTITSEEGINLNPSISGDGRMAAFETTEDVAGAGGRENFRAISAQVGNQTLAFRQMAAARAPAPAVSQNGSFIAFAALDDPLGTNADGNSEIFLYDASANSLRQVTTTSPGDVSLRSRNGNYQPSISDDGRFITFASNRDFVNANADANFEIFVYDTFAGTFTQITNTANIIGSVEAKISGDASRIAFIRDTGAPPDAYAPVINFSSARDLLLFDRNAGTSRIIGASLANLAVTYGRATSDDGTRIVFSANTAAGTSQVFLYDERTGGVTRQITTLGSRTSDVPLHPSISGDGARITFATRRTVTGTGSNSDASVELYLYDLPTAQLVRLTNVNSSAATAEVVSALNDAGTRIAFNFPRILSGAVANTDFANNSEIYLIETAAPERSSDNLTVLNGASFGREPSQTKAVAPDSITVARGTNLSLITQQTVRQPDGTFPRNVAGTTVMVNGRTAQIFYVSPTQVNFLVPAETEIGQAQVVVTNADGFQTRGTVTVLRAAPGVFTVSGDGQGEAIALDAATGQRSPFEAVDSQGNPRSIIIFTTGVRSSVNVSVIINNISLTIESITPSPDMPGLDQIQVRLDPRLSGAGVSALVVRADGRDSNPTTVTFGGRPIPTTITIDPASAQITVDGTVRFTATVRDANGNVIPDAQVAFTSSDTNVAMIDADGTARGVTPGTITITARSGNASAIAELRVVEQRPQTVLINEILADPPDGAAGDANRDGLRDASQDEFVEVVNATSADLNIGGYQILTRASTGTDVVRHTFAANTILRSGAAAVVFGGAQSSTFNQNDPAFGGATVDTASTGGLSLLNGGSTVTLRDATGAIVDEFTYGGSTGLNGGANQSLTRSPDVTGDFVLHSSALNNSGRIFSPGTRTDGTPFVQPPTVASIELTPDAASVIVGNTTTFTATARESNGNVISGLTFNFSLRNASPANAATITATTRNTVTMRGDNVGSVTVVANYTRPSDNVTLEDTSALTITNPPPILTRIEVEPTTAAIQAGGTQQFSARAFDQNNNEISGVTFTWASSNANVATINQSGLATGANTGTTNITASSGNVTSNAAVLTVINPPTALVISQVYGGGGNTGAPLRCDFVEIFNRGTTTINFTETPYSIQYTGATGNFGSTSASNKFDITNGTLAPGAYLLIKGACGATGADFTADFDSSLSLAATAGKVALVSGTASLTATACPVAASIVDFVGYGSTANCFEGAGAAAAPGNTTAIQRANGGCQDTNNNAADFTASAPAPRSAASSLNDCHAVVPAITINDVMVTEGDTGTITNAVFTVMLSTATTRTVMVNHATADNTATFPADYQTANGTLTFNPGETTKSITVQVNGDTLNEADETFTVNLSNATNAAIADNQGVATITNDDSLPTLSINDATVTEGNAGTIDAIFTVTLSAASGRIVTTNYTTTDGTAFAPSDYQATGGTLTFAPGETSKTITVRVAGDTANEANETFSVVLSNATNAGITRSTGTGTITNDDTPPNQPPVAEAGGPYTGFVGEAVRFDGSGSTDTDGIIVSYQWNFGDGTTGTGAMPTHTYSRDGIYTVTLAVTDDDGATAADTAQVTITVRAGVGLVISQVYGAGGLTGATYQNDFIEIFNRGNRPVNLDGHTVQYASGNASTWTIVATLSGTLQPGQYFLIKGASGGSVGATFTADAENATNISQSAGKVAIVSSANALTGTCPGDDGAAPFNPNNPLILDFSGYGSAGAVNCSETSPEPAPANNAVSVTRMSGGCTDTDNNSADFERITANPRNTSSLLNDCNAIVPAISISDLTVTEGNAGTSVTAMFTLTLSAATKRTVSVDYATANGTATAPADYQTANGTITFNAGETTKTVSVTVNGDDLDEANETFFVNLTNAINATIADGQAVGTITDDDPSPTISINDSSIAEGNSGTTNLTFTITLSAASGREVRVDYATADGTATSPADYQTTSGTLIFAPSETTKTVTVAIKGDTIDEPDETFSVNLLNAVNATIADNQGVGTITDDDPASPIVTRIEVSPATATINRGGAQQFTAIAFDQNNQPVPGATFTWSSGNPAVATINQNGSATGVGIGTVTITATTSDGAGGTVSGTATLTVLIPLVINEILADPPGSVTTDLTGDANRDGVRDGDDDEFIELLNNSNAPVDLSGVIIADATSNRFTFPANTTLAAGRAVVIFGGGTPPTTQPAFGGALILTTSSLGLTNTGDTVTVKLPVSGTDVVIATQTYATEGNNDQSLTRSPDAGIGSTGGAFVQHTSATNAAGRRFSPGTRADGTPIGSPAITRIEVAPATATINTGQTQTFTARAFSNVSGSEVEIANVSFIWDSSDPTKATVGPTTGTTTTATGIAAGNTTIRAQAGGHTGTASLTVNAPPALSIDDVSMSEGNSGTTTFSFTVSLSTPAQAGGVTFDIATQDNTAIIADNDYIARSLTAQTIPAGQQTYMFNVTVNADTAFESNETFFVNVTNVSGATIADGQAAGTILNDDSSPLPALSINDVMVTEGNAGTVNAVFIVTLSATSVQMVTVNYATVNDTATAGTDYQAASGTITFAPGETSKTITVTVNGDTTVEPDETFFVNLSGATNAAITDTQGVGTITNDDVSQSVPNVVISQIYAGGGNTNAQFRNDFVELFNRSSVAIDVSNWSIQTATAIGTTWTITRLCPVGQTCTIPANGYYLVQLGSGGAAGTLLTPDATGTVNLAVSGGKVALLNQNTMALSGSAAGTTPLGGATCPTTNSSGVLDFVGYGSATCFEGSNPAHTLSNTTANLRLNNGCTDTNNNAADFTTPPPAPSPRNSTTGGTNTCP